MKRLLIIIYISAAYLAFICAAGAFISCGDPQAAGPDQPVTCYIEINLPIRFLNGDSLVIHISDSLTADDNRFYFDSTLTAPADTVEKIKEVPSKPDTVRILIPVPVKPDTVRDTLYVELPVIDQRDGLTVSFPYTTDEPVRFKYYFAGHDTTVCYYRSWDLYGPADTLTSRGFRYGIYLTAGNLEEVSELPDGRVLRKTWQKVEASVSAVDLYGNESLPSPPYLFWYVVYDTLKV